MKYDVATPDKNYVLEASNASEAYVEALAREGVTVTERKESFRITDIIGDLPRTGSNGTMNKNSMKYIVVHHDAEWRPDVYDSLARYKAQAQYHVSKGWKHISYHFSIDNVGEVFQMNPINEVGWHAGNYWVNRSSIGIKFDGNMEQQDLTEAQIKAYKDLINYLTTQRPDLPNILGNSIRTHAQVRLAPTACPGKKTMVALGI